MLTRLRSAWTTDGSRRPTGAGERVWAATDDDSSPGDLPSATKSTDHPSLGSSVLNRSPNTSAPRRWVPVTRIVSLSGAIVCCCVPIPPLLTHRGSLVLAGGRRPWLRFETEGCLTIDCGPRFPLVMTWVVD